MGDRTYEAMKLVDELLEHEWRHLIKPFLRKRLSLYLTEIESMLYPEQPPAVGLDEFNEREKAPTK